MHVSVWLCVSEGRKRKSTKVVGGEGAVEPTQQTCYVQHGGPLPDLDQVTIDVKH